MEETSWTTYVARRDVGQHLFGRHDRNADEILSKGHGQEKVVVGVEAETQPQPTPPPQQQQHGQELQASTEEVVMKTDTEEEEVVVVRRTVIEGGCVQENVANEKDNAALRKTPRRAATAANPMACTGKSAAAAGRATASYGTTASTSAATARTASARGRYTRRGVSGATMKAVLHSVDVRKM